MTDAPTPPPAAPAPAPAGPPKTLSIISMIAGILGIVTFGWAGIFSIAAVILGFMGKSKEPAAKGFWLTGIITGFVGILFAIINIVIWVGALALSASYGY